MSSVVDTKSRVISGRPAVGTRVEPGPVEPDPEPGSVRRRAVAVSMATLRRSSVRPREGHVVLPKGQKLPIREIGDSTCSEDRRTIGGRAAKLGAVRRRRCRIENHCSTWFISQRKAGELLGGGPRAFQKYESGAQAASAPMSNLLRLLANDPSRLREIVSEVPARRGTRTRRPAGTSRRTTG